MATDFLGTQRAFLDQSLYSPTAGELFAGFVGGVREKAVCLFGELDGLVAVVAEAKQDQGITPSMASRTRWTSACETTGRFIRCLIRMALNLPGSLPRVCLNRKATGAYVINCC